VLQAFYVEGEKLQTFIQLCAVNTLGIFFRILKYLQVYPYMDVMFATLRTAIVDTLFFLMLMTVFLMGYVFAGHQVFGAEVEDFSSISKGFLACLRMFLGTFNYAKMRRVQGLSYVFFSYTFMVLFRFIMVNMFFAIIDKHFRREDKRRAEVAKALADAEEKRQKESSEPAKQENGVKKLVGWLKALKNGEKPMAGSGVDAAEAPDATSGDFDGGVSCRDLAVIAPTSAEGVVALPSDDEVSNLGLEISDQIVQKAKNYKYLPDVLKTWAVERARDIKEKIDEHAELRRKTGDNKSELETVLQNAEQVFKDQRDEKSKQRRQSEKDLREDGLHKLKDIHQDQESLAWYIMRREVELKKLDETRSRRQEHFERLKHMASAIVSNDAAAIENGSET